MFSAMAPSNRPVTSGTFPPWSGGSDALHSGRLQAFSDLAFTVPRPHREGVQKVRQIMEIRRGTAVSEAEAEEVLGRIITVAYYINLINLGCFDTDSTLENPTTTKN